MFAVPASYAGNSSPIHLTGNPTVDLFGQRNYERGSLLGSGSMPVAVPPTASDDEKSPWIAGILSLAVPGAGEWYADSKPKGVVFFGVEVASWVTAIVYNKKGDHQTDVFQDFANQHYSASRYALWTLNHLGALNSNLANSRSTYFNRVFPGSDSTGGPPFSNINWVALNSMERAVANGVLNGYTHEMPYWNQQQYYELIGKYDQFNRGWDDANQYDPPDPADPSSPIIRSNSKEQFAYADMRATANHYYDIASTFVSIAVINHVVSALDAYWTATRHNDALHAEVFMHLQPTPLVLVPISEARIQYSF